MRSDLSRCGAARLHTVVPPDWSAVKMSHVLQSTQLKTLASYRSRLISTRLLNLFEDEARRKT